MSVLEIVILSLIGLGLAIWATILIVKGVQRKRKPKQDEENEEIRE